MKICLVDSMKSNACNNRNTAKKHLKIKVQNHEIKDFPLEDLSFSNNWIKLLDTQNDTHRSNNRYTLRY